MSDEFDHEQDALDNDWDAEDVEDNCCPICKGTGKTADKLNPCPYCKYE